MSYLFRSIHRQCPPFQRSKTCARSAKRSCNQRNDLRPSHDGTPQLLGPVKRSGPVLRADDARRRGQSWRPLMRVFQLAKRGAVPDQVRMQCRTIRVDQAGSIRVEKGPFGPSWTQQ